jgi:hypothetical protein
MTLTLLALAALSRQDSGTPIAFQDFEKRKYEAFTSLQSFRGRYSIFTTKADGSSVSQDLVYQFGPKGRQMLVLNGTTPLIEMGWNEKQIWRVSYPDHTYSVNEVPNALDRKPFEKLAAPKNQMSFSATDTGIRFGFDPEPAVTGPVAEVDSGKDLDKYSMSVSDPDTSALATVTQWTDKGTFLVRKFEIRITQGDKPQMLVRGVLFDDDERALVPTTVGDLPLDLLRDFRKLGS